MRLLILAAARRSWRFIAVDTLSLNASQKVYLLFDLGRKLILRRQATHGSKEFLRQIDQSHTVLLGASLSARLSIPALSSGKNSSGPDFKFARAGAGAAGVMMSVALPASRRRTLKTTVGSTFLTNWLAHRAHCRLMRMAFPSQS